MNKFRQRFDIYCFLFKSIKIGRFFVWYTLFRHVRREIRVTLGRDVVVEKFPYTGGGGVGGLLAGWVCGQGLT